MNDRYKKKRYIKSYTSARLKKRTKEILSEIEKIINLNKNYYLLDIGTFDGYIPSKIKEKYKNIYCIGIDNSFSKHLNDKMIYSYQDGCNLAFKNEKFDVIISSAVIEHIKETENFLKETHRVLKKGSFLILTFPNPIFDFINSKIRDTGHVKRFYKKSFSKTLERIGFKVSVYRGFILNPFTKDSDEKITEKFFKKYADFFLSNRIVICEKHKR